MRGCRSAQPLYLTALHCTALHCTKKHNFSEVVPVALLLDGWPHPLRLLPTSEVIADAWVESESFSCYSLLDFVRIGRPSPARFIESWPWEGRGHFLFSLAAEALQCINAVCNSPPRWQH